MTQAGMTQAGMMRAGVAIPKRNDSAVLIRSGPEEYVLYPQLNSLLLYAIILSYGAIRRLPQIKNRKKGTENETKKCVGRDFDAYDADLHDAGGLCGGRA
jgi:hypothetical protein